MKRVLTIATVVFASGLAWAQGTPPAAPKAPPTGIPKNAEPKASKTQPAPEKADVLKSEKKKAEAAAKKYQECVASCEASAKDKFPLPRPGSPEWKQPTILEPIKAKQKAYVIQCKKLC